ncbi:hypothetical protein SK3146_05315 [Paenibacillus konkukensis]|uniref:Secreted protein n=1 Tax=Paenibacillus konkukensis TaxID=2020716 RepID=A0ABY4RWT6_9BACL|nr:hypothetical protein SK3146_05315 [Paenibacillus konkukensis]
MGSLGCFGKIALTVWTGMLSPLDPGKDEAASRTRLRVEQNGGFAGLFRENRAHGFGQGCCRPWTPIIWMCSICCIIIIRETQVLSRVSF